MNINTEWLNNFFSKRTTSGILRRRESISIEFKEKFDWIDKNFKSKIAKTAAAFSNTKGGVIFFGIKDNPHSIIGIDNWHTVDNEQISTYFNTYYSPHIDFELTEYIVLGKKIGIMVIYESKTKPLVCIRDSAASTDSSIFYRYNGSSALIKSGDLHYLLSEIRYTEQSKWMNLLANISKIGVDNIGFLDESNGILVSNSNNKFLLDENLLQKIKIVDRYSESEDGAPALKIIGEIQETAHVVERLKGIYEENIYEGFLGTNVLVTGKEYLEAIFRQNSEIYPIYKFISENVKTSDKEKVIKFIESIKTRSWIKKNTILRIENDSKLLKRHTSYSLTSQIRGPKRKIMYDKILNRDDIEFHSGDLCKDFLEAVFNLKKEYVDENYIIDKFKSLYIKNYPFERDGNNYLFRWAMSYIDMILYN